MTPEIRKFTGSKTEIVPKSWTITHEAMFICDARNKAKLWTKILWTGRMKNPQLR